MTIMLFVNAACIHSHEQLDSVVLLLVRRRIQRDGSISEAMERKKATISHTNTARLYAWAMTHSGMTTRTWKSYCLGCAVLLYLVVCLTLLASFFLPSFISLTCHVTNCQLFPLPCRYLAYEILDPYLTYKIQVDVHQLDHKYSNVTRKNVAYWKLIGSVQIGPSERGAGITDSNSSTPQVT